MIYSIRLQFSGDFSFRVKFFQYFIPLTQMLAIIRANISTCFSVFESQYMGSGNIVYIGKYHGVIRNFVRSLPKLSCNEHDSILFIINQNKKINMKILPQYHELTENLCLSFFVTWFPVP